MVRVTEELALSPDNVILYQATDPLLGHLPVLIFHGPSTTANHNFNSSRVQVHIYSPAGFQSFPRLTISPNSPFYNVVNHLPREFQGDEIYRALAFGLFKYFHELPDSAKNYIRQQYPTRGRRPGSSPTLFGEQHAADIAKSLVKAENTAEVVQKLQTALQTQHISNVDIDLVLPPGAVIPLQPADFEEVPEDEDDILDPTLRQYGMYTPLIKLFGEPIFLPTSRLRRAPSKPSALNRTKSFSKDQKIELRRKMAELVDTEERYVLKVNELVTHVADEYRQKAKDRQPGSFSPSADDVEKLFPKSSEQILQINTAFMRELRKVMDDTEEDALKDVESGTTSSRVGVSGSLIGKTKDASGALAMAKIMLEWFPKFTDCYQDYIRSSQNFPQLITSFVNQHSSFSQRVALTGEQHLRSTVIEPVQRLPRYSLVIDQIVGCLPITHPALQPMLKARDIIANICSMDDPMADKPHVSTRLRNMIESWPNDLEPQGRLIVAADFSEVPAPYQTAGLLETYSSERAGMFLLFADCVVVLKKVYHANMTARDLLREIDKPSPAGLLASMTNAAGGPGSYELGFAGWHALADVRFTESSDGRIIWMTSSNEMKGAHAGEYVTNTAITSRCFVLQESYEGRAAKWSEDVVRARVEGRFPEKEREDPGWTLRSVKMPDTGLGLYAAVFQEGLDQLVEGRREPAPIRIVVDHDKGTKGSPVGHYGVEICSDVKSGDWNKVIVITVGLLGKKATDEIALEDFLPTLARRIIQFLSTQFNVTNPSLTPAVVSFHTKVLRGLSISNNNNNNGHHNNNRAERARSFLGTSPVKYLSSFLGGASSSDTVSSPKHQRTPALETPTLYPGQVSRANSSRDASSLYGSAKSRDGIRMGPDDDRVEGPLVRLEQTFTGYMASLQARKGSFIGRTLLNRSGVDELAVNDLYNKLIESPYDFDFSSDLNADVIFEAFEKFVLIGWRDKMGPIMTTKALDALQERASKRVPGDFADFVHFLFADMAPQNRRAFTALIKLLADLLDGCGNDSDRGALTLAFARLLVDDGTAHEYINLLDKLVEDCDRIFDDAPGSFAASLVQGGSIYDSMNSTTRGGKSQTGSLTSNTSSLRRKLGFDNFLMRQNSKNDADPRSSVWRSLSKHNSRNPATGEPSSLSRATVNRTRSVDIFQSGPNKLRRPGSRDRPPVAGAFDDTFSRPTSSQKLETIGEPDTEESISKDARRKRRSSLSDLKSLMAATSLEDETLQPLSHVKETSEKFNSSPRIPSPSRIPVSPKSQNPSSNSFFRASRQNEILFTDPFQTASPPSVLQTASPSSVPRRKGHHKMMSTSSIPTLKTTRDTVIEPAESTSRPATSPTKAPGKLRLQSPQKLRERLQVEKKAVEDVDANLQSELSKITADMAKVNSTLPRTATVDIRKLSSSIQALEDRVPKLIANLSDRQGQLQKDMDTSLKAAEAKVKAIDQLYKEGQAENELLYEKFNSELGKIVKALKGKGREDKEELISKMKDCSEETARVKKENARLRREMISLRALVKGNNNDA
ncbi:Uu.00g049000.m01.CDS01 [Anthostomella pinea]|uniref:Uu.00g049000.m01.CDS01 n=1 Tax=Anthostomella pinea TaxID=933095 RepID=A0AAI8VCJ6_9PEZI|nr:Uu.00g049000.m01.CDS01 [Anthostomella pinea]